MRFLILIRSPSKMAIIIANHMLPCKRPDMYYISVMTFVEITVSNKTRLPRLLTALLFLLYLGSCGEPPPATSEDLFTRLTKANDQLISEMLSNQIKDGGPQDGGFHNQHKIVLVGPVGWAVHRFGAGYILPGSRYYKSPEVLEAMEKSIDFLLRKQHADGTIDLLTTNFHSTPDIAFIVEPLALGYKIMAQQEQTELEGVLQKVKQFLINGGETLTVGGIHTPNHRWVVCMALARINDLFPNQKYVDRIEEWLAEKIDIDGDGQFTERSTGVYSPLTDRCLITVARLLNKGELYEPVRRNLEMSLYHQHPNGEIATEASRRQDQYRARDYGPYFYPYLYMAHLDQNPTYGAMAQKIKEDLSDRGLARYLLCFLEEGNLSDPPPVGDLPIKYRKHYPDSELVRIRDGNMDATILAKNNAFFTLHKGEAVLQAVRLASAFFGKGQVVAEELEVTSDRCILKQNWTGPYYQPYPVDSLPDSGVWEDMPRENRPQSEVQKLSAEIIIYQENEEFVLDIKLEGTDHVPVALELAFRKGGKLSEVTQLPQEKDSFIPNADRIEYKRGEDIISVSGFKAEHEWTQLRGADPKIDAESVYFTSYTPFSKTIRIK